MKTMTYDEFKNLYGDRCYTKDGTLGRTDIVECSWVIGGAWGGNCWNDDEPELRTPTPDAEPTFLTLDTIINDLWSDISLNDYRMIVLPLVSNDTNREQEYYGNYTDYAIKRIKLEEMFDILVQNGKISA